ncbi:MAG: hypothetical protein KGO49_13905 [Gammaproteobacteria bacterium]|nr:hypothetical protein [Gammaproteobacteria bacterium]
MKHIKAFLLILLSVGGCSVYSPPYSQAAVSSVKVHTCSFDFEDENFCDSAHTSLYDKAWLNNRVNFDENYIISSNIEKSGLRSLAVINLKTGDTYPLEYTYGGYVDESGRAIPSKPSKIDFQINSNKLCIDGSVYAYQNTFQNQNTCFIFNGKEFEKLETNVSISLPDETSAFSKIKSTAIPISWDTLSRISSNWSSIDKMKDISNWYNSQRKLYVSFPRLTEVTLLPKVGNITVLLGRYNAETDSGNIYLYSLITINNNASKYVKLNNKFWIDKNYLIKGIDSDEGKTVINYKISNDGVKILSAK